MRLANTTMKLMPRKFAGPGALPLSELLVADPDLLRDSVFQALSSLDEQRRRVIRERLLAELKRAGLRVRATLLMLGASASTAEELTAPEIAALIRYVRLTAPGILKAISALGDLLSVAEPAGQSRWAA